MAYSMEKPWMVCETPDLYTKMCVDVHVSIFLGRGLSAFPSFTSLSTPILCFLCLLTYSLISLSLGPVVMFPHRGNHSYG